MKTLLELQKEISAWASSTFKDQNISSKMKHFNRQLTFKDFFEGYVSLNKVI